MRRVLFAAVMLAAVLLSPVSVATSAGTVATAARPWPGEEERFLELLNEAREDAQLPSLRPDPAAGSVARAWSGRMARADRLVHNPDLVARVDRRVTTRWRALGENVGTGPDVESIDEALLQSPSHRDNALGDYDRVGIGVRTGRAGQMFVTFVFIEAPSEVDRRPAG